MAVRSWGRGLQKSSVYQGFPGTISTKARIRFHQVSRRYHQAYDSQGRKLNTTTTLRGGIPADSTPREFDVDGGRWWNLRSTAATIFVSEAATAGRLATVLYTTSLNASTCKHRTTSMCPGKRNYLGSSKGRMQTGRVLASFPSWQEKKLTVQADDPLLAFGRRRGILS